jgi:hypothetical protein
LPDPQLVQAPEPILILNLPASHAVHGPPLGPVKPALQIQAALPAGASEFSGHDEQVLSAVAAVTIENLPLTHWMHVSGPGLILYLPSVHALQVPPLGPE